MLFEQIVTMDLEGMVCKQKDSPYKVSEKLSRYWIKVMMTDEEFETYLHQASR